MDENPALLAGGWFTEALRKSTSIDPEPVRTETSADALCPSG